MQAAPAVAPPRAATILCCNCGVPIDGTTAIDALCHDCFKLTVDISKNVQREGDLYLCRDCDRWHSPPELWIVAQPESKELLSLCLKNLRGLNKVRIIDAGFLWTEPHSRRIKVKITIQQEVSEGAIVQQMLDVEYVVNYRQCPDCQKSYTHHTFKAIVQVRQKVPHKRTFLYLEQLILKHSAHKNTQNISESHDGIDFFFAERNKAEKFVNFLTSVAPVRVKKSAEHISTDVSNATKSTKFTFSVEIVPICKDDLVALPIKLAKSIGNIAPLVLCYRIGTTVNVLDPNTLQTAEIPSSVYWHAPFSSLADVQELVEFIVMDIEPIGPSKGRMLFAEATVAKASDLGVSDTTYFTRTHLGAIIHPGDSVLGYLMTGTNWNHPCLEAIEASKQYKDTIPDVILVKKHYTRSKKKSANRSWKVKRLTAEQMEMDEGKSRRRGVNPTMENDFEMFLRDVEEDEELRAGLNLYRAEAKARGASHAMEGLQATGGGDEADEDGDEDEGLEIPMDQLLDEMDGMELDEDGDDDDDDE